MSALFHPDAIERRIDESLGTIGKGNERRSIKRASLLTLVVVNPRSLQAVVSSRLDCLFGRRPLRIIRLETGHTAPTAVDVRARCLPHPAGDEVCFQEIVFSIGPDASGLEPGIWSPLVIRDLPAVLLWLPDPEEIIPFLDRSDFPIDKCVIDCGTAAAGDAVRLWPHLLGTLGRLGLRFTPHPDGPVPPVLSDLGWRSLDSLRVRIARLFDPPAARGMLTRLTQVALTGLPPFAAVLIVLWLAARLGWIHPKRKNNVLEFSDASGHAVIVSFEKGSGFPAVFFTAGDGGTLGLGTGAGHDEAPAIDCGETCLLAEIDRLGPDPAYYELLATAARFMDEAGTQ